MPDCAQERALQVRRRTRNETKDSGREGARVAEDQGRLRSPQAGGDRLVMGIFNTLTHNVPLGRLVR
jgi:hypothetical protein